MAFLLLRLALYGGRLLARMVPIMVIAVIAVMFMLNGCAAAYAAAPRLHVSTQMERDVTNSFREALRKGGMSLVANELRYCYSHAVATQRTNLVMFCALYDGAAHYLDNGMRQIFRGYGRDPGPGGDPIFMGSSAFFARMKVYAQLSGAESIERLTNIISGPAMAIANAVGAGQ